MKCYGSLVCFLSVFVFVSAAPFLTGGGLQLSGNAGGNNQNAAGGGGLGGLTNILSQVDLPGLLRGINSFVKLVGVFCPPCSQILDNVIQNVTSTAFRVFGRAILQGGGLGGGGASSGGGGGDAGNSVSVVLPTFPPDEDDYDDEETSETPSSQVESSEKIQLDLRAKNDTESATTSGEEAPFLVRNSTSTNKEDSNVIVRRHARVAREVAAEDQVGAESAPQPDELDDLEEDDQDRNKRFLPFGGGDGHSGGSGNFLFDIIRNTADRAARMVGTVYRMVAGTQHFGWGASSTEAPPSSDHLAAQSSPAVQLVAGSGATEESDEKANSPEGGSIEADAKSADHYSEGIPGPITRLLVIANRGVANLVQDLILRLAQTSERLVNFKARLITSLI
ncbi:unnamed protein product [Phyllotreta striolata]|uniref:Uncharacterized protein n=1 Tax=Phyllotreta striolata TaxID=444603 RepID=A0A9N9TNI9_PHYSR|nr:unnamed protein product [Phyllotreta striolata]